LQDQPSPKRVEALRGVPVSSVSVEGLHSLALAEDGQVYAWGVHAAHALLRDPRIEREPRPKPVEALRAVGVRSIAAAGINTYLVADTGELWAWEGEFRGDYANPLGHDEQDHCLGPKLVASLRGIKVDTVAANEHHTIAQADDGSVYAWGKQDAAACGALGLGPAVSEAGEAVLAPHRIPGLRVALA
jgi:alpha-tubulin suppressor-like RCC1 family protein